MEDSQNQNYQWIFSILRRSQIKNVSFDDLRTLFPGDIELDQYWLVQIGHDAQGNKQFVFFKIMSQCAHHALLRGPHQILGWIQGSSCLFWVNSLTRLKHHFMGMCDRLSFERSTYVLHSPSHSFIRLRCMRRRLVVPKLPMPRACFIWNSPHSNLLMMEKEEKVLPAAGRSLYPIRSELTRRTHCQLKRAIEQMMLSYSRDLPGISNEDLRQRLFFDFQCILQSFQ